MTRRLAWKLLLVSLAPSGLQAQEPDADIFSGTVVQLTDRSLTVVRNIPGQAPVTRDFTRDRDTTVEGKLRNHTRVTVRYKSVDDQFVAIHIIVRQ